MASAPACRACGHALGLTLADLGETPLANALVREDALSAPVRRHRLHAMVCEGCWLVQLDRDVPPGALFSDYLYLSSFSSSWLAHAASYVAEITERRGLGPHSRVVEIGSNDGYLLRNFVARGIPCLGVEPAANVARMATEAGIATIVAFFGRDVAVKIRSEHGSADLLVSNNVLAHAPDIHDFVGGIKALLAPRGVWTVEFPHLLALLQETQFDTIYHEHVFYLSLLALEPILARHGLHAVDVQRLATHGGSLRLHVAHEGSAAEQPSIVALREEEKAAGLAQRRGYAGFQDRIATVVKDFRDFITASRAQGRRVAAYGAAAKGATLLDVAGVGKDDIAFVCDRNPAKQGLWLPGSRLPVVPVERLAEFRPDYTLVLPWNLAREIESEIAWIAGWNGKLVRAVPKLEIWSPG